ncbi:MAG: sialidase family protein, partial [Bryobacteraceae bacterium]
MPKNVKLISVFAFLTGVTLVAQAPQRVEGFASLIHSPSAGSRQGTKPLDFRGPASGHMTAPWWTTGPRQRLKWRTAAVPEKRPTVCAFTAATSVPPADVAYGPKGTLYFNGKAAVTFDTGQTRDRVWKQDGFELRYESRRSEWPYAASHRQFSLNGDSGIYSLSVPAASVTAGQAATIEVELLPFPAWPNGWFMVKARTDTLSDSPQSVNEQVRQLQRDVTRLQELTHVLATNQYTALLGTAGREHSVIYTNGFRHLHPADLIQLQNGELLITAREAAEHISRDGDVILLRSKDGGKTWGEKHVIAAVKDLDEREGCGVQLKNGTIVLAVYYNGLYGEDGEYGWNWANSVKFGQG